MYRPSPAYADTMAEQLVFDQSVDFIKMEWRIAREIKDKIGVWYIYLSYNNSFPTS